MTNTARNAVVFAVVVIVHAVLLLGLAHVRSSLPSSVQEFHSTLIFIAERKPSANHERHIQARRNAPIPYEMREPQLLVPSTAPTIPIPLWREQAREAATNVVARNAEAEARRSLSKQKTIEQPSASKDSVSLFPAPLHRNGETQRLGDGEMITWVSDTCYATNRPFEGPQLDENRLNVVCKDPFKDRTDLFDHLKPKYLQASPTPDEARSESTSPTCSYSSFRCK